MGIRSKIKKIFSKKDNILNYEQYLYELSDEEYLDELFNNYLNELFDIPELLNNSSKYSSSDNSYKTLNSPENEDEVEINQEEDKKYLIKLHYLFQHMDGYDTYKKYFDDLISSLRKQALYDKRLKNDKNNELYLSFLMSDNYPNSDRLKRIEKAFENKLKDYYEKKLKDFYKQKALQGYGQLFTKSSHSGGKYIKKTKKTKKRKTKKRKKIKVTRRIK